MISALQACPVCFQVPRSKILSCTNAHKICESCYDKTVSSARQCPQGNCPYDEPPRRCRELEAIVDNADLELSCSNANVGCTVEMRKEGLRKHEVICTFREVPCPDTTCEEIVVLNNIDSHISENHQNMFKLSRPGVSYF